MASTGTFQIGTFTITSTAIEGKDLVRHTITETVSGRRVADNASSPVPMTDLRTTAVAILTRIAASNPTDPKVNPKSVQKQFPTMIAKEVAVWEAAKAALADQV